MREPLNELFLRCSDMLSDLIRCSRDGESIEDARRRVTGNQFRRFAENFRAAAAGNMIVLRHAPFL